MELHKNIPVFLFQKQKEWEEWLFKNHDAYPAIWIKFVKKNSGATTVSYAEAVPVAFTDRQKTRDTKKTYGKYFSNA